MELRQLEYFAAVVRHRNFGRAAQEIYVTQSALSQQVRRLEDELGLTLLLRTPQGVQLTPAGVDFLEHVNEILGRVAAARVTIDEHARAVRGIARVAATPWDAPRLGEALAGFHRTHPQVHVLLRHGSPAEVVELVAGGAVDVGIAGVHGRAPRLPETVGVTPVVREPLVLLSPPRGAGTVVGLDAPGADGVAVTIDLLRDRRVILPERGTALRELIAELCEAAGFGPLPLFETSDPQTVRRLVAGGLGVAVLPTGTVAPDGPTVTIQHFAEPEPVYEVALLSGSGGKLPVRDLLAAHLAHSLAGEPPASG
jgi:DNA-binding transcriptional LysR family regulator